MMSTAKNMTQHKASDHYKEILDSVIKKRPFHQFTFYYKLLTPDKKLYYFEPWIDYVLDRYNGYKKAGFKDDESQVNSIMDGLEELLKE